MKQKMKPKIRPKREPIPTSIPLKDYIKNEITSLKKITNSQPTMNSIISGDNSKLSELIICSHGKDYALNDFLITEKIVITDGKAFIKEYRYALTPAADGEEQYFRFDFQPFKIPIRFPDSHINVNEHIYGKHHLIYPTDTELDLHKLTIQKAVNVFCYYENTFIHPATDLGKAYVSLVNGGKNNENIY